MNTVTEPYEVPKEEVPKEQVPKEQVAEAQVAPPNVIIVREGLQYKVRLLGGIEVTSPIADGNVRVPSGEGEKILEQDSTVLRRFLGNKTMKFVLYDAPRYEDETPLLSFERGEDGKMRNLYLHLNDGDVVGVGPARPIGPDDGNP